MLLRILLIACLFQYAYASENLEPEESQFSSEFLGGYTHLVLSYLSSAYEDDVIVRLIGLPSFSPEYLLGIKEVEGKYSIFYESPKMQLWGYQMMPMMEQGSVKVMNEEGEFVKDEEGLKELESQYPKDPLDIPRVSCNKNIEKTLANDIIFVWREMVYETKYPREPNMGLDGETYHFSAKMWGNVNYAGKVWSPPSDSKTGKLVAISELMYEYCLKGNRKTKKSLAVRVKELHKALKSTKKSSKRDAASGATS